MTKHYTKEEIAAIIRSLQANHPSPLTDFLYELQPKEEKTLKHLVTGKVIGTYSEECKCENQYCEHLISDFDKFCGIQDGIAMSEPIAEEKCFECVGRCTCPRCDKEGCGNFLYKGATYEFDGKEYCCSNHVPPCLSQKVAEDWEDEAIEKLAGAVTHSEQGEYAKNEHFVKNIIVPLRSQARKEMAEECLAVVGELEKIGTSTYCDACGQHIASGDCNCSGINQERSRIRLAIIR